MFFYRGAADMIALIAMIQNMQPFGWPGDEMNMEPQNGSCFYSIFKIADKPIIINI